MNEHDLVLCVDDDSSILSSLRRLLRREPYEFVATADPGEALRRVERENVRVLIADERMPGMSGTDLLKAVEERSPRTVRVMLTAYPDARVLVHRIGGHIQRLLTKPWNDRELKRMLAGLLCREDAPQHIDCRDRTADDVAAEVAAHLDRAPGAQVRVILQDLRLMCDAPGLLFEELSRQAAAAGARLCILEPHGSPGERLVVELDPSAGSPT